MILRNWGWTNTPSKNENILKELGDGIQASIYKKSGVRYTSERGAALYPASGATDDWATTKGGMAGFTIELRDTGRYGFNLPASQIVPTGEEIWSAMKFFIDYVINNDIPLNSARVKGGIVTIQ